MQIGLFSVLVGVGIAAGAGAQAENLTIDEFRRDLVGVPLCGIPETGPLSGKTLCTVHLPDGSAILAGSGVFVRGFWEPDGSKICRRNASDTPERRRCIEYERLGPHRFRNSDGVEFCIGPCM